MTSLAHQHGRGVEVDEGEAVKWYTKLAEDGHNDAQFIVAHAYEVPLMSSTVAAMY